MTPADRRPTDTRTADTRARMPDPLACLPRFGGDDAPPQFAREDQAFFLDCLAQCGNVLAAARRTGVSRSTVYRMRRACPRFADLWDAALLLARPQVEAVLADRAINGVEETVYYQGEAIATRRRYDSRLLLAHLARLDRLAERHGEGASPADFERALNALESAREITFVAAGGAAQDDTGTRVEEQREEARDAPQPDEDEAEPVPDGGGAAEPEQAPADARGSSVEDAGEHAACLPDAGQQQVRSQGACVGGIFSSQDTVSGVSGASGNAPGQRRDRAQASVGARPNHEGARAATRAPRSPTTWQRRTAG